MKPVLTKEQRIELLEKENKQLRIDNEEMKKLIKSASINNKCTCDIGRKGYAQGNDFMSCPVHGDIFSRRTKDRIH